MARRLGVFLCLALLASLSAAGERAAGPIVNFGTPTSIPTQNSPQSIAVADFNADGDLDLAVANSASASVSILTGGLGGTFSAPTHIAIPGGPGTSRWATSTSTRTRTLIWRSSARAAPSQPCSAPPDPCSRPVRR